VKICGLTRAEDAALAVALGADALGFVFWSRSPRAVRAGDVRQITERVPPLVTRVGVFVDASPSDVAVAVRDAGLDVVQLHGGESPEAYRETGARLMKVATLDHEDRVEEIAAWPEGVMPLVDAIDHARKGGTGRVADWARAAALSARRPIVLAGGLTAENVREAVAVVRPWAVDVSSGVESAPGRKSADRMRAFFAAVAAIKLEDE
jgi:phosphoribosylanthranilate isomerase